MVVAMLQLGKRLWKTLTKGQQRRVLLLTGAVIIMAVLEVVNVSAIAPFLALASDPDMIEENVFLGLLYDYFSFNSVNSFLVAVGLGVFALMLLSNAWSAFTTWAQLRLVWSWNHQLSVGLLGRYLYRPYSYFLSRNTADLSKNLLSEVQQITNDLIRPVILAIGKTIVAVGIVGVLVFINPALAAIVTVVVGGCYGVIYAFTRKRLNEIGQDRVKANEERFTVANEALGGIKEVKVLNVEQSFLDRFIAPSRRFSRHQAARQTIGSVPRYAIETIAFGTVILIVVYLIAIESDFDSIVPMLGLYAFAGYRLMPALQQVFSGITSMRFYGSALEELLQDLSPDETIVSGQQSIVGGSKGGTKSVGTAKSLVLKDGLQVRDLSFTYPNTERAALDGVSLEIQANSTIGFVGATGSGKTTFADVILGLLRPQSGQILVDGVPITEDNLPAWQRSVGYVPQEIFLTDSSIAENIAFGIPKDQVDMEAVRAAAEIAQIDKFIMDELPRGYDTVVGERGIRLSGGQRQRIGIARALYRDPKVILFDEATSALDNTTESYVMQAMQALHGRKTVVLIAHRLTTLAECDVVFVLERGRLVSEGTYASLIAGNIGFERLHDDEMGASAGGREPGFC